MPVEIGQLIEDKYRIVRLVGEGGMGSVYEGENVRINRRVAIKVLHAAFSGNQEVMQRFEREAQAAGRIGNDHILEVLDLGSLSDGDHFIVMEFLEGEPLSDRIRREGKMVPRRLAPLVRQVLVGLGAAHAAGIIHRDLKPDNIFVLREKVGQADFVKIIDFGISKFQPLTSDAMKMTRTGAVMGTPYYMSPEQASGSHDADQRSDLYSVGVIMFEAVSGQVPFDAATFNQLMFKIVLAEAPSVEALVPDIDPAFASIIAKAMARDVTHRFQTAQEFALAIDDWLARGAAVTVPPPTDAAAVGLVPGGRGGNLAPTHATPGAGGRTAGTWEQPQPEPTPGVPRKTSPALVAVALGGSLLLLGALAFGAARWLGGGGDGEESELTAASSAALEESPPPEEVPPPPEPEVVPAPPEEVAPPTPSSAPSASEAPEAKVAPKAPPRAKAPPKQRPTSAGTTPPKTRPKSGTPDFGY